MPKLNSTIPIAYLKIRGANLIVVFLDSEFASRMPQERSDTYAALQIAAQSQGIHGDLAAVWEDERGRTRFLAPPQQHPFFEVMNYGQLRAQANGTIHV